jgi:Ubiquitin carboxyl-terminal hydrolase
MDLGNADTTATASTADAIYQKALNIVCRIPLLYDRKNANSIHNRSNAAPSRSLGSVRTGQQQRYQFQHHSPTVSDEPPLITFAQPSHNEEKELISEIVGNYGIVFVNIPSSFSQDESFDIEAMHSMEVYQPSVPSTSSRGNGGDITVLDCIEKFCQKEQLEESEQWYCSRCKQHVCAWKQFHIYRCPPHLIVHLKRFQFSARTHRRQKINIHVDFPLTGLDLSKQVLHWNNDDEKPIYDCYAVSNHYGGLGGGHYTAYAINDDGVWCHYDDSRITSHISPSEVVSSAAYVLYYRRRDVPVDMEYIQKIVASPQTIITHQQQQDRSYISPYTVIGRDDMNDGVDNMEENGPLLPHHSEARVMRPEAAVVPLFEGDDDDDTNNNFEDSATNNCSCNHDALTATDRDDDETGSHSSDDGLPLPSGLRVSSASAVTGAMIIDAEDDEEVEHEEKVANITCYDNDEGTEEFYDTMTATDPVVENDDDERVGNDDEDEDDDESPTVTATTEGTATRLLPLQ